MQNKKAFFIRISPRLFLEDEIIFNLCHIGEGEETCRYLVAGAHGYACIKFIPQAKAEVDKIAHTFVAKGDNCPGMPMLDGYQMSRN
jgi:hypothetical protein